MLSLSFFSFSFFLLLCLSLSGSLSLSRGLSVSIFVPRSQWWWFKEINNSFNYKTHNCTHYSPDSWEQLPGNSQCLGSLSHCEKWFLFRILILLLACCLQSSLCLDQFIITRRKTLLDNDRHEFSTKMMLNYFG